MEMEAAGGRLELNLWDTAGQEAYEKLRLLIYPRVRTVHRLVDTAARAPLIVAG